LRPTVIRLSDDLLDWLDAHRGDEPRVALIRSILREHIRRHKRSAARAASRARATPRAGVPAPALAQPTTLKAATAADRAGGDGQP
jgi:hypothetical protein